MSRMRDLTRYLNVTTHDIANWSRRGVLSRIPQTRAGAERRFSRRDHELILILGFLKVLTTLGVPLERAHTLAVSWAQAANDGNLERYWLANPRSKAWREGWSDGIELRTIPRTLDDESAGDTFFDDEVDASWSNTVADQEDLPATTLIVVDRLEIVRRVARLCEAD